MTPTSPARHVRFSPPRRNSIVPEISQKICSCGCVWAAAWAPAFIDHRTTISLSPTSTRREILSVIFSSGRRRSAWKPFMLGIGGASFGMGDHDESAPRRCQVTRRPRACSARPPDGRGGVMARLKIGVIPSEGGQYYREPVEDVTRPAELGVESAW